jgi:hypothetical protein
MKAGKEPASVKRVMLDIGMIGLAIIGCLMLLAYLTTPAADYGNSKQITGSYDSLEKIDSDGGYYLTLTSKGYTAKYTIDSFIEFDPTALTDAAKPGDELTVRYAADDEWNNVMEIKAGDTVVLSFETASAGYASNRRWGLGMGAALLAVFVVCGAASYAKRRREKKRDESVLASGGSAQQNTAKLNPEVYTDEEYRTVTDYIERAFGPVARVFHEPPMPDIQVDIAVVDPTDAEPFFRLVTIGMGAKAMEAHEDEGGNAYAELAIFLPREWNLLGSEESDTWPFYWLKKTARLPWSEDEFVSNGDLYPTARPLGGSGDFRGLLLSAAEVRKGSGNGVMLPDKRIVNFYQLNPVLSDEIEYARVRGTWNLMERMRRSGVSPVVDMRRAGCCGRDWFAGDIAPFEWSRDESGFSLTLNDMEFMRREFERNGFQCGGESWKRAAREAALEYDPASALYIRFEGDAKSFRAVSESEDELRKFALAFRDCCSDTEQFEEVLYAAAEEL